MQRYWVSWWTGNYEDEGCTKSSFQHFTSGERDRYGDSDRSDLSLCAVFDAENPESIWNLVAKHFPDYEERFCEECDSNCMPSNRFPGAIANKVDVEPVAITEPVSTPFLHVYRYETPVEEIHALEGPTIFLGGPTVRGNQPHLTSWRFAAIEEFARQGFEGNLVVPEFTDKAESDNGKEWIPQWEYAGLCRADSIMFWIPRTRELIALTTNYELGYWTAKCREKVVYGRPDDAYRIDYTDIMWKLDACALGGWNNSQSQIEGSIYRTLSATVAAAIQQAVVSKKV